jgi:hypothetical protein
MDINFALDRGFTLAFLLGAPFLLAIRLLIPKAALWWQLVLVASMWGWLTAVCAIHFNHVWLNQFDAHLVRRIADPVASVSPCIFERATGGHPQLYGWSAGLAYFFLCSAPYWFLCFLMNRSRTPLRGAQIFLAVLLAAFVMVLALEHVYAAHEENDLSNIELAHLQNAAFSFGAVRSWLCILCAVTSVFLAVALIRRKSMLGLLVAACAMIMGFLAMLTINFA